MGVRFGLDLANALQGATKSRPAQWTLQWLSKVLDPKCFVILYETCDSMILLYTKKDDINRGS